MDAASVGASSIKTVNSLSISTIPKITSPTTLTPPWLSTKPSMLTLYATSSNLRNSVPYLTRCSTKPDTNTDNEIDQNSAFEPNSNPKTSKSSAPVSNEALSSSLSTSSSSSSSGLVFGLGPTNSWDGAEIGSPVVKRFLSDEEERWYMWYHGRSKGNPGSEAIGLAVSRNGIHWERGGGPTRSSGEAGLAMNCSTDWWAFDTESIRPCEVVVMSSAKVRAASAVYWLYYTGCSSEKAEISEDSLKFSLENPERFCIDEVNGENGGVGKISKSLPGLAISQDGRHWARIEAEHHSGALFDVGSEREWDSSFIASPQVVFHVSGDLRMYYHSFDAENGEFGIGIARSRDGIRWVKLGKIMGGGGRGCFDEFGVMNARAVRNQKDGNYVMAYEGIAADGRRSIGLAVSSDGLKNWRRFHDEAALAPSAKDGWDNEGVGSPCLVQMDRDSDGWRLYYKGAGNGGRTGIGMAVSEGSDIRSFRRWTGFNYKKGLKANHKRKGTP
ncbi:hypothetical protein F2P56_030014 [Juglans regia]|uniref:Uncharacterized protein n=2 Tax=Juglans regia TaxID=51240 RepID=A0A833TZ52_JUGRE|nr:uncharacterized protein LOC118344264 [Juglans regia]KAF5449584.1 hypothetical protein F2P56_030014 [Juglans regia]